jgi:hypothetical protein
VGRRLLLNPAGGGAGGGADDVHTGLADAVVTSPAGAMAWLDAF